MHSRKFPVLGTSVPPMLGRSAIMSKMLGALTKPTPDHLQVVGPRFAGKTVILHELAHRLRKAGGPYTAFLMWDLGHHTPATDELFMQRLAGELSDALIEKHADYARLLNSSQASSYQDIAEILDALEEDGGKVLAIMDGFDKPLSNGQLTRNLWDQLRELGLKPSLRFVTASRRTLRELIRNPDAQTSDFWNIFEPSPVRVGCFDESDLNDVFEQMPTLKPTGGAKTELWNATNGFPVMVLEVLNVLDGLAKTGEINADVLRSACDEALPLLRDEIDSLWMDCPRSCQDLLWRVLEQGSLVRAGVANADADTLIERGFVHQQGNKLQRPNRLVERFLGERPNEGSALDRLFSTTESYQQNFKGVLERRIEQISGMDFTLRHYLDRSVGDLPKHPDIFLTNVRGIVNRAFELIWSAELEARRLPSEWIATWKYNQEQRIDDLQTAFPQGRQRVRLLQLMTGTDRSNPCAKHVTKSTYELMNAAHAFGDFGQHQEGAQVDPGTAYAVLHLCVELASALSRELPNG